MPGLALPLMRKSAVACSDEHLLRGVAGLALRNDPSLRKIHSVHCGEVHVVTVDDDRHHIVGRSVEHPEPNHFARRNRESLHRQLRSFGLGLFTRRVVVLFLEERLTVEQEIVQGVIASGESAAQVGALTEDRDETAERLPDGVLNRQVLPDIGIVLAGE